AQDTYPYHLDHERNHWRLIFGMQFPGAAEEQSVLRHGVIDTGSGENEAIVAAETGDHNRCCHQVSGYPAKHLRERRCSNTFFCGMLNSALQDGCAIGRTRERQDVEV